MHTDAGRATRRSSKGERRGLNPQPSEPQTKDIFAIPGRPRECEAGKPRRRGQKAGTGEFRGVKTSDARGPRRGKPPFSKALRDVVEMFGRAFDEARAQ
jgi:hypothetical protein